MYNVVGKLFIILLLVKLLDMWYYDSNYKYRYLCPALDKGLSKALFSRKKGGDVSWHALMRLITTSCLSMAKT